MYDEREPDPAAPEESLSDGSQPEWSWEALVPHLVHPTKVQIIEALLWIDRPLSAADLAKVFNGVPRRGVISYHVKCFADHGVLTCVRTRRVRGATERFYRLSQRPR